jgi:heterodisulfide reductase subunit B
METHYGERLNIPVIYFTQLLGLALGIPERELGLHRSLLPMTYKQKLSKEELVYA